MFNNFLLDEYLYNEPYLRNFFANIYDLFVDYKDFADAEGDPPFGDAAYLFLRYMLNTEIEKEFFDYSFHHLFTKSDPDANNPSGTGMDIGGTCLRMMMSLRYNF